MQHQSTSITSKTDFEAFFCCLEVVVILSGAYVFLRLGMKSKYKTLIASIPVLFFLSWYLVSYKTAEDIDCFVACGSNKN